MLVETILDEPAPDRRPIAARRLRATVVLSDWLIRHRASPNAVSLMGMGCALLAGVAFAAAPGHWALWLAGALLVQLRLLANMLDGMVAIGRGIASPLGEIFNEVPDRVSDTAILVGLGLADAAPWLGLAAALAAMATAYIRVVGKAAGRPSDFCGPMAKQHRMALVTALAIWCAIAPPAFGRPALDLGLWIVLVLATGTAARRLLRLGRALQGQTT
jgi:phosphatidylglycerophosphate synthase